MTLVQVPLGQIDAPLQRVRGSINREGIEGLALSVKEHGVVSPITVVRQPVSFRLVAGERRFLAAVLAKVDTIPALVIEIDEQGAFERSLVENVQREDMNPLDEAVAIQTLMNARGIGKDKAARLLGKTGTWVDNRLRLLKSGEIVQAAVREGEISIVRAVAASRQSLDEQQEIVHMRAPHLARGRRAEPRPKTWREKAQKCLSRRLTTDEGEILLRKIEEAVREILEARKER